MQSLFEPSAKAEILNRIEQLTPASQAQWGKMNAAQMLAHCQTALHTATGDLQLKRGLISFLFGGIAKRMAFGDKPFKRNLPTDPHFIVVDQRQFEKEKTSLVALIDRFAKNGASGISRDPHPFFGKLTAAEWDTLMWKHLDHHLRQFGV